MRIEAKDYAQSGYEVIPGTNGGFVVIHGSRRCRDNSMSAELVAFTNATDMIAWLSQGHAEAAAAAAIPAAG